jgi:hypothetical protein
MMEKLPDSIREKIDKETAAFKPFYYGYCKKCVRRGCKQSELWCFKYGKKAGEIWACDFFIEG